MKNFWQDLPKPFSVLAPMDDVTDNVFRKVINETARPDVFFTEFTNVDGIISKAGSKVVGKKLKFESNQNPVVAQIWGNNPDSFYRAAHIVKEMGFVGIDINMGCPVREVVKKCAGAGLIGKYDLAEQIISAVKKGGKGVPVSVKTRLGISTNIITEWATFLLKQDLAALTIHGRTAVQMSKVPADWNEIGHVVKIRDAISPKTLIIGNGDVKSYTDVLAMHKRCNVDGVMIGRGVFDNPWVFNATTRIHSITEYIDLLVKHFTYFEEECPESEIQNKRYGSLKKFFKMYVKDFKGANLLRQELMETENLEEARNVLSESNLI